MIDRNQNTTGANYSETMSMEQELEELKNSVDPSWWINDRLPGTSIEEHFERLQGQFFVHHARVLLHMPFMLRSSTERKYQYSHSACLESAREVIKSYDALRGSESVGPHACKVIDFQAFTAAMLLLLNLCGYSQQARGAVPQQPDLDQDQRDSVLIDRTITLLNAAALEAGGTVAVNSAKVLDMLAKIRHGHCAGSDSKSMPDSCRVSIPYFGTISISIGKQFVPIKPGTYPEAGRQQMNRLPAPSQTGLPTPPSMASHSSQPSPRESLISDHTRQSPYWNNADSIVQNYNQQWTGNDDPFVTFDSFMAFPSAQTIDFSGVSSGQMTNGSAGSSDYMNQNNNAFNGIGTLEEQNMAAGFPFPAAGGGNVDLDHGWNWFGVGAPTL